MLEKNHRAVRTRKFPIHGQLPQPGLSTHHPPLVPDQFHGGFGHSPCSLSSFVWHLLFSLLICDLIHLWNFNHCRWDPATSHLIDHIHPFPQSQRMRCLVQRHLIHASLPPPQVQAPSANFPLIFSSLSICTLLSAYKHAKIFSS